MTEYEVIAEFLRGCTNTVAKDQHASECPYCLHGAVRAMVAYGYADEVEARNILVRSGRDADS